MFIQPLCPALQAEVLFDSQSSVFNLVLPRHGASGGSVLLFFIFSLSSLWRKSKPASVTIFHISNVHTRILLEIQCCCKLSLSLLPFPLVQAPLCCSHIFPRAFLWFIICSFTSFSTLCRRELFVCSGSGLEVTAAWPSGLSSEKAGRERDAQVQKAWWVKHRKAEARLVPGWSWHVLVQLDFSEFPEALKGLPGGPVEEVNASWLFRMKFENYLCIGTG